ncbi:MAG: ISAzo13 family transposase, partial [Pyrinomonadaceae bacterium]
MGAVETTYIKQRFELLKPFLNEQYRRIIAAAEAAAIGYGGASIVAQATGVSRRA